MLTRASIEITSSNSEGDCGERIGHEFFHIELDAVLLCLHQQMESYGALFLVFYDLVRSCCPPPCYCPDVSQCLQVHALDGCIEILTSFQP